MINWHPIYKAAITRMFEANLFLYNPHTKGFFVPLGNVRIAHALTLDFLDFKLPAQCHFLNKHSLSFEVSRQKWTNRLIEDVLL